LDDVNRPGLDADAARRRDDGPPGKEQDERGASPTARRGRPGRRSGGARAMHPFEVLGDVTRRELVEVLAIGRQTSGDLASILHERRAVGWSSVSQHLGVLLESGFVVVEQDGPRRWYHLRDDWLDLVTAGLDELRHAWDEGASSRELGAGPAVMARRIRSGDVVLREPGDPVPPLRDARRGRNGLDLSARGVGRSHWSDDADGSSDLD
jgi:DNA-binding transcriptional ArsR family regulator